MARRPKPWYRKARRSWFVTISGVQHHLGSSKSEAYERFHQLMRQPQQKKVSPESFAAIADAFLDWVQHNRAEATYEWYQEKLQQFLRLHKDLQISELRPYHVQAWVDKNPDHSPTTKRNKIRVVKRCLSWAVQQGYIDTNPVALLEAPSPTRRDSIILPDQFSEMLALVPDPSFADLMQIVWETGCRPQECLRLEARHVDLEQSRWVFSQSEAKVKSMPRAVYLTDRARQITERRLRQYPDGKLFRNSQGKPWTKDSASCAFDRLRVRIGKKIMQEKGIEVTETEIEEMIPKLASHQMVKGMATKKTAAVLREEAKRKLTQRLARKTFPSLSLYTLRHSWATLALQRGVDSLTVAILMGHKDPSTLARVYQHLSHNPGHLLDQARRAAG